MPAATTRIPSRISVNVEFFDEPSTFRLTRNNCEIKKLECTGVTTIQSDNRLASGTESTTSDTEKNLSKNSHQSEKMPSKRKSPDFNTRKNNSSLSRVESSPSKKMFECAFCSKTFKIKNKFFQHELRHSTEHQFNCKYCGKILPTKPSWDYHVKSKHLHQREFACGKCDKTFITKYTLSAHIKSHKYLCNFCEKSFTTKCKLNKHKEIHKIFKCDQCPVSFFREYQLRRHKNSKHSNTCFQSMIMISEESNHQPEEQIRQEEESLRQEGEPICQDEKEQSSYLEGESSREVVSPSTPIAQKCKHCEKTFSSVEDLHQHWRVTGDNLIICARCFEICNDELDFSFHLLKHSEEKIFMCTLCSKTFVTVDLLEDHFSTHINLFLN